MLCEPFAIVSADKYRCFPGPAVPSLFLPAAAAAAAEASGRPRGKSTIVLGGACLSTCTLRYGSCFGATMEGEKLCRKMMNLSLFSKDWNFQQFPSPAQAEYQTGFWELKCRSCC